MPDGMSHAEKIGFLGENASIDAIKFDEVIPDGKNDWLDQRDESFSRHIGISEKAGGVFPSKSYGLTTNRDVWCYNASSLCLSENVNQTLDFLIKRHEDLQVK
jgi:predicted helicase